MHRNTLYVKNIFVQKPSRLYLVKHTSTESKTSLLEIKQDWQTGGHSPTADDERTQWWNVCL